MDTSSQRSLDADPIVRDCDDAGRSLELLPMRKRPRFLPAVGGVILIDERAALAKEIHDARRARDKFFPSEMFADPAWDILLILYWANHSLKRLSVTSACAGAAVPQTTALRWIETLRRNGLVRKTRHPLDARVNWLDLTEVAKGRLDQYLDDLLDNDSFQYFERVPSRTSNSPLKLVPSSAPSHY